jgi:two-component system, chemotaxis family, chemotaxis protein CheY
VSIRILIVDDSPVIRAMVRKTIALSGLPRSVEITEAANGREALTQLEQGWVDLVLTDLHMPVMGGEALVAAMREHDLMRDIPIVIVSSNQSDPVRTELERAGCRYLKKPFRPEDLASYVRELLHLQATEAAHVG